MQTRSPGARRIVTGAAAVAVAVLVLVGVMAGSGAAAVSRSDGPARAVVPTSERIAAPAAAQAAPTGRAPAEAPPPAATPDRAPAGTASAAPDPVPDPGPVPTTVPGTPCTSTARACVDLAARSAWLVEGGAVRRGPVPVMIGDEIDPTPLGTFEVEWKAREWTSREYLTQMPNAVFFADGGIAFHEGNQETNSAGCVKLDHENSLAWFDYLQVGDEVQIR